MANITHKIFTSRVNGLDTTTYVGEAGRLFYAQTTGTGWAPTLRYSDGSTVGGLPISGSSISVSGAPPAHPLEGNLWYDNEDGRLYVYYGDTWADASPDTGYTLPVASTSTLGGVKADGVTLVVNTYTGVASVAGSYVSSISAGYDISVTTSTGAVTVNSYFTATTSTSVGYTIDFSGPSFIRYSPAANNQTITLSNYVAGRKVIMMIIPHGVNDTFAISPALPASNTFNASTNSFQGANNGAANGAMLAEFWCTTTASTGVYLYVTNAK